MTTIQYKLIRSSRKTLCISIRDGEVIVRAPAHMSIAKIEDFIRKKSDWILKQLSGDKFCDELSEYKYVLVKGKKVALVFGNENKIEEGCVTVKNISDIQKLYTESFGEEFLNLFREVCLSSGLKANSVRFKSYKSRWGCCDNKKNIIFNFKLLMLPVDLWRCVIVHELCHTVFMDHSKNFHALANSVMKDYSAVHKKLKNYCVVTRLY
ncbi:MAG: M48 family metallopeptidase [Candidatus Coproplasma sp.]